jgi:hypothetical protein
MLPASRADATANCCGPTYPYWHYKVINVTTRSDNIDFNRPVASCSNPGGTCTITTGKSLQTTVGVDLGITASQVAGALSFSLSRTSTTTVGCTSPRLSAGQTYKAFRVGVRKYYRVQKYNGPALVATSGLLTAWQPYSYTAIHCTVY